MGFVARALVVLAVCAVACGKADPPAGPPAQIVDLSASFEELKRDFDAHRGEARFLTLLAPT